MATLRFEAGDHTESIVGFVTSELDDSLLDTINVDREVASTSGLASEPITLAATITLTTTAIVAVLRIVERWLEMQRQLQTLEIVADGFAKSSEAGEHLTRLAEKHAEVTAKYPLAKETWGAK
jgi:hypothetical protein